MSNLSQVKVGSTTYDLRDYHKTGVYTVKGTQTESTGSWTGVLNGVSALYDGLTIAYFLPYSGDGNATLNLTLDGNVQTGAINCYVGTDRLSTQYLPGMVITLTYFSAGSVSVNGVITTDNRWIAPAGGGEGEGAIMYIIEKQNIGSASTGTAIPADDITSWTTNQPTQVTAKTVVTGGTKTAIPNISKKTVVTSASGATASISTGVLTLTNGSFSTGDSVTVGTAIEAYTTLNTGDSVTVTPGVAATLAYTAKSIPNITVTQVAVVTELTPTGAVLPNVSQDPDTRGLVIS